MSCAAGGCKAVLAEQPPFSAAASLQVLYVFYITHSSLKMLSRCEAGCYIASLRAALGVPRTRLLASPRCVRASLGCASAEPNPQDGNVYHALL